MKARCEGELSQVCDTLEIQQTALGKFELIRCSDSQALARAAAAGWRETLTKTPPNRPIFVALSGGRIAPGFFNELVKAVASCPSVVERIHFFWADERCVPPDHPESCFRQARENLLEPLQVPANRVHRIRGEDNPEAAAQRAALELRSNVPAATSGLPVLDLVFLGMGEDGHVASLFPGEPAEFAGSAALYRAVRAPKPPPDRVTMSYGLLRAAREVWVLVSGAGKSEALHLSLSVRGQTPLARVIGSRPDTRILTDIPMASAA